MISSICQKSNSGIISTENKELINCLDEKADYVSSDILKKYSKTEFIKDNNFSREISAKKDGEEKTDAKTDQYILNSVNYDPCSLTKEFYAKHPLKKLNFKKVKCMNNLIQQKINEKPSDLDYYLRLKQFLAYQKNLIEDINKDIQKSDVSQLRRKELIYKNWHLNVYEPIQREIQKNMNSSNALYARSLRNIRYMEFLNQVNEKGCVYRDDFQPEEYDPTNLVPLGAHFVKPLKDPTSVRQRKNYDEEKLIYKCITGKKFTSNQIDKSKLPIIINDNESRADIDWNKWILNNHSTINSTARIKSSQKCKFDRNSSEYNLNWDRDLSLNSFVSSNSVYIDHSKSFIKK
ncbi:unnamed protein product [Brachionus calyciflorus]|uniref:Uncharacterized protein n=1 Tax=Brachionus calyciflorus TaxID=104777 RepID=A0A813U5N8_9BILA|nr:unnamed protein product [Brachionus calyciflorus]